MSTLQTEVTVPSPVEVPHGTSTYQRRTPTLLKYIGRSIWRGLESMGRVRASAELNRLADNCEPYDPERARQLRAMAHLDGMV